MTNQHYSLLDHASHVNINGGTFQLGPSVTDAARDRLEKHVALNALPDSGVNYHGPKCYPETRTAINNKIQRWIRQQDDLNVKLMWLHGGAGAGKSAIMRTTALGGPSKQNQDNASGAPHVLGSFFFYKNDPTRNTERSLIPTLAMQLCDAHPAARDAILRMVADKREAIFTKPVWVQVRDLLSKPLATLGGWLSDADQVQDESQPGRVFIIDGLDECSDRNAQADIIEAISLLIRDLPIRVLLASRPEEIISSTIRHSPTLRDVYSEISLSDDPNSDNDIRLFLEESLKKIAAKRRFQPFCSLPAPWPAKRDVSELVAKSSRHFIYASTAAKYIASGEERPDVALRVILGLQAPRTGQPFAELDTLYRYILGKARFREEVLRIIAFRLFTSLDVSTDSVHLVLRYPLDDIYHFLSDMRALITIDDSMRICLLHNSFQDFLCDEGRAREFYIGTKCQFHRDHVAHFFAVLDLEGTDPWTLCQVIEDISTGVAASPLSDTVSTLIQQHPPHFVRTLLERRRAHTLERTFATYMRGILQYDPNEQLYEDNIKKLIEIYQKSLSSRRQSPNGLSDIIIPLLLAGFDIDTLHEIHDDATAVIDGSSIFAILSFNAPRQSESHISQPDILASVLRRIRNENPHAEEDLESATLKMLQWVALKTDPGPREDGRSGHQLSHPNRLAGNLLRALAFVLPRIRHCPHIALSATHQLRPFAVVGASEDAYSEEEMRQFSSMARTAMDAYWQRTLSVDYEGGLTSLLKTCQQILPNRCPSQDDLSDIIFPLLLAGFDIDTLRDIHVDAGAMVECSAIFTILSFTRHCQASTYQHYNLLASVLRRIRDENPHAEEDLESATIKMLQQWVTLPTHPAPHGDKDGSGHRLNRLAGNLLRAVAFVLPRIRHCLHIAFKAAHQLHAFAGNMGGPYSDEKMYQFSSMARSAMDDYWQRSLLVDYVEGGLQSLLETYQRFLSTRCHLLRPNDLSDITFPLLLAGFDIDTLRDICVDAGAMVECSARLAIFSFAQHQASSYQPEKPLASVLRRIRDENPHAEEDLEAATIKILQQWVTLPTDPGPHKDGSGHRLRVSHRLGKRLAGNLLQAVVFVLPRLRHGRHMVLSAMRQLHTLVVVGATEDAYSDEEMRQFSSMTRIAMDDYWQHSLMDPIEIYREGLSRRYSKPSALSIIIIPLLLAGFDIDILCEIDIDAMVGGSAIFAIFSFAQHQASSYQPAVNDILASVLRRIRDENPHAEEELESATIKLLQWVSMREPESDSESDLSSDSDDDSDKLSQRRPVRKVDDIKRPCGGRLDGNILQAVAFVLPRVHRCRKIALSAFECELRPLAFDWAMKKTYYSYDKMRNFWKEAQRAITLYKEACYDLVQ